MQHAKPTTSDEQHMKLLSIFHYVLAAIYAVVGCFPVIHLSIGIVLLLAPQDVFPPPPNGGPEPPMQLFGAFFAAIALLVIALNWGLAALLFYGGRSLSRRRHHTFCLVIAGISCLLMPLGTILGVFTIIVLNRPAVKAMFEPSQPAWPSTYPNV